MQTIISKLKLPKQLTPLSDIAANLWWTWNANARALFEEIDPKRFDQYGHNPIKLLCGLSEKDKIRLQENENFMRRMQRVHKLLNRYTRARTWYAQQKYPRNRCIAYFSMEFGLHESLPIFAGGLGVLAGDHFKSASDLGLPIVGIGIFWRRGYVRQRIDGDGSQSAKYDRLSPDMLPLEEVRNASSRPIQLKLQAGDHTIAIGAWRLNVGRVPIYLLDTNLPENKPEIRSLTGRLYAGDRETRILQEIVLGMGGWQLLNKLKAPVAACHLNEGHAAFCQLQRIADLVATGKSYAQAKREVSATTVFTTHTPVPAGNEAFAQKLAAKYLRPFCEANNLNLDRILKLSRVDPTNANEEFGMTPLALRLSTKRNGVSALHGEVSRKMWAAVWPGKTVKQVPIKHVTNGVHTDTWMHPQMAALLDAYLPKDWRISQDRTRMFKAVEQIPDEALWTLHESLKQSLVELARQSHAKRLSRIGASKQLQSAAATILEPNALTIGFARRFATYKRATLIFSDLKRLDAILNHSDCPVQLLFSGKAHPADTEGQSFVAQVCKHAAKTKFRNRIVFLEDYDMNIARHLVSGVDVWLNNPRRPQEASGTSGMKPALHGGLNLSILDGWWPEGYERNRNGWAIGEPTDSKNTKMDDLKDAKALYRCLEKEVVPLFYKRDRAGLPKQWIRRMKLSIMTIAPQFNSHRMVKEYLKGYYLPLLRKR